MLSRIAESLFWIGRYVERADDTARIVQVHLRQRAEDPWVVEQESSRSLLALMGIDASDLDEATELAGGIGHAEVLRTLVWDRTAATSVISAWNSARENARRAREVIPSELWEGINTAWRQLPTAPVTAVRAHSFLDWNRERAALVTGLARQLMMRDDGWQFLLLGRSLEQADMSSRMVASGSLAQGSTPWPAVLRGCGAHDAFIRTYRGFHADREAAEFLILDERFPRSVMHGLTAALRCLEALDERPPEGRSSRAAEPLQALGRVRARLKYAPFDDLLGNLAEEMAEVQRACDQVSRAVTAIYFSAGEEQTPWTTERTL